MSARTFLDGLQRSVAAIRQHGPLHAIAAATVLQFQTRWSQLQFAGEVEIDLQAMVARCGGEEVRLDPPLHGDLLAPLQTLGIGRLLLLQGMAPESFLRLAIGLATFAGGDADGDLVAQLRAGDGPGPRLLPAVAAAVPDRQPAMALELLPSPCRQGAASRTACAREQAANLPVHAARLLLTDVELLPAAEPLLLQTIATIAERGDLAGYAMVLEQCHHQRTLSIAAGAEIRDRALALFAARLAPDELRRTGSDQLLTLVGLSLQLGDAAVQQLVAATAAAGVALPDWLLDAIRQGRRGP